jgi:hypothetical protein
MTDENEPKEEGGYNLVTCKFQGRLGNQLFQAATTIAHATNHGAEWRLPKTLIPGEFLEPSGTFVDYQEPGYEYHPIPFLPPWQRLVGYFQSEIYFKAHKKVVLTSLNFNYDLELAKRSKGRVAIHVRRGDFLEHDTHPVMGLNYYTQAMGYFADRGLSNFLVFSDDQEWVRENFTKANFPNYNISFQAGTPLEDLFLMSHQGHGIIANSSFSWWGNWLPPAAGRIVITPKAKLWVKGLNTSTIIPKDWIQI